MTPSEFKTWFDGFCEAFDKAPSQKQWARIKERVAEIDGKPVTEKVYVDQYWPGRPWRWGYWPDYGCWGVSTYDETGIGSNINQSSLTSSNAQQAYSNATQTQPTAYNSINAMNALGRSEAQAMS